ncbi:uncharacterized protein Z520_08576 [Fonsecaea multimorphosa CBS 102226]|uniref:Enoyl reductase (ER) domain-containing protein n=1 Tax=Fonsecaea multimorphosa CBS 102226 TaxID=1442371 RepID=A0A0D2KGT6_9EURO|nr:uncharacterized protein Z520_08576 [Fonsecaea multimorphosa CBS 102226]KIX95868.1 hypothetical protein Z520_08576 [Fonsecaea multimorphosa CBS 102226]OAL21603.1 hypothetical protein AYO22_07999 [Fonsecaea multimorphosa]
MPRNAVTIRKVEGDPGKVYYPLERMTYVEPEPEKEEAIVQMTAAALNHRDFFIRKHLYPGTTFGVPLLSDGCGVVSATGSSADAKRWLGKRVILNPGVGWESSPEGPEDSAGYRYLGGTKFHLQGTLSETVRATWLEVEEVPEHLTDIEAAALPLAGLTAWRALVTKSGAAAPGRNILVTGIGGGVALMVLLFASAMGVNVYVTSGSDEKLEKARSLEARGGVNYKANSWEKELLKLLPAEMPFFDAIIDGAGGDVVQGGVIVSYGMTLGPEVTYSMSAVLKNIEIRGSTGGSRKEFRDMVRFVKDHHVRPVISSVVTNALEDLGELDKLFDKMKDQSQFGKLVVTIGQAQANPGTPVGTQKGHKI